MLVNCAAYQDGRKLADIRTEEIGQYVSRPECFVWVALKDPAPGELAALQKDFDLFRAIDLSVVEGRALLTGKVRDADTRVDRDWLTYLVQPFLVAAGVGAGNRNGTGLAAESSQGGATNQALMDLLLQHGANINAQVTGTETYSMRISRAPSAITTMLSRRPALRPRCRSAAILSSQLSHTGGFSGIKTHSAPVASAAIKAR